MFATVPGTQPMPAVPAPNATTPPAAVLLGLCCAAGESSLGEDPSTRATSPSSSTGDDAGSHTVASAADIDSGALAQRRGRSVLMLSELVIDFDSEGPPGGSPSEESSSSSLGVACGGSSSRCTPCTPQMVAFSPPTSALGSTLAGLHTTQRHLISEIAGIPNAFIAPDVAQMGVAPCAPTSQMVDCVMGTALLQMSADASQRRQASAGRLGGAAAGGDASQRSPVPAAAWFSGAGLPSDASQRNSTGRVSLGVAAFGGDASQRSPPGCATRTAECSFVPMQQSATRPDASHRDPLCSSPVRDVSERNAVGSILQGITGTSPGATSQDSSRAALVGDASQRHSAGSVPQAISVTCPGSASPDASRFSETSQRSSAGSALTNLAVEGSSDAVKSWLSGSSSSGLPVNDIVIAQQLRAAIPESYED